MGYFTFAFRVQILAQCSDATPQNGEENSSGSDSPQNTAGI